MAFHPRNAGSIYCGNACYATTLRGKPKPRPYKQSSARQMTDVEAAWLAGFIDGEGSIIWTQQGRGHRRKTLRLSVGNTNRPALERCHEITGCGSIVDSPHAHRKNPLHSMAWNWWVYSASAADVLRQILPHLTIKREKAEAAVAQFELFASTWDSQTT